MKNLITENLSNPGSLEQLYRSNPTGFKHSFQEIYPEIRSELIAQIWHVRLQYSHEEITWGARKDWAFAGILAVLGALWMHLPTLFPILKDVYFARNTAFIFMSGIAAYLARKQRLSRSKLLIPILIGLSSLIYVNALPVKASSDTLFLTYVHLPILTWLIVGHIFCGAQISVTEKRINFLRFHGDLLVMSAVIMLAGGLFSALTIGLFKLIDIHIEEFYGKYFIASVLPSVPLLATVLVHQNPTLVSKISPVIARIFTPLVSAMLMIFLVTFIFTGKDPYNDREFLLLFNGILIGVMALLLFSISESTKGAVSQFQLISLVLLAFLAIINNGIALSAIVFRLAELGITPNRIAVLGSNSLILLNLIWVARQLIGLFNGKKNLQDVELSMTRFLPYYALWVAIVSFIFPLIFSFQ